MTLPHSTIKSEIVCIFALILSIPISVAAQKVAVLTPDGTAASRSFAEKLETELGRRLTVIDDSLGEAAFAASSPATPFNMTTAESKSIGAAIGCHFFILVKSATLRRSSLKQNEYYESSAAAYLVSSRTGRLVFWKLSKVEAANAKDSQKQLDQAISTIALEMIDNATAALKSELTEPVMPSMEEPPSDNSPTAKNFRAPIPYRRFKPEYTAAAFLYGVEGSVEILVDLDARGTILRTEIVRWAGYGLDESVEKMVRSMNWRPAERNGKPLPMRFLLRYNFRKLEKE